jgi:hypothetical protein
VRDVTDLDFGVYAKNTEMFGTKEARRLKLIEAANKLQGINKSNRLYHNNNDLTFTDTAKEWGLADPSYSNGAAYADFDNDGDLDLVVNNLNSEAFLYENRSFRKEATNSSSNFLRVQFTGGEGNREGIGANITLYYDGKSQHADKSPQRGYKSTVESSLHFGLGKITAIDSLVVKWPGFKRQKMINVKANQTITLRESDAEGYKLQYATQPGIFSRVGQEELNLTFRHEENDFIDFKVTPTLPRKHSLQGPAICTGDINGDGLTDFIVGGSAHRAAVSFFQTKGGDFRRVELPAKTEEDAGMLLFDADRDGDLDLYCASGSTELGRGPENYHDRLYVNNGQGSFRLSTNAIPGTRSSKSCVIGQDFDRDGDIDLFVGGRIRPGSYPLPPQSYVFENNGKGIFTDITEKVAPQLKEVGMITSAIWTDFDNDGWPDLLAVGEFMPVTLFRNDNGKQLVNSPELTIKNSTGWWNSVAGGDFDNDGDTDYVLGNLGLNSAFKASPSEPVCVYAKDFDQNGSIDPVLSRFIDGTEYPVHPRETLTAQIVGFKKKLRSYEIYGKTPLKDLLTDEMIADAHILKATEFRSSYLENLGNNKFELTPLSGRVQYSPVFGTLLRDINDDGKLDIICIGNDYATEPLNGHYDAGIGNCLIGDGQGRFTPLDVNQSAFSVAGDAKALVSLPLNNKEVFIGTQNRDSLVVFTYAAKKSGLTIRINQNDQYAMLYENGSTQKKEFYFGESYLSQSDRCLEIPRTADSVAVINSSGEKRIVSRKLSTALTQKNK